MNWTWPAATPLDYFASLVAQDADFALLEAAICLAQDDEPQLDVQQVLAQVDALVVRLRQRLAADAPALHRLRTLNHFFYGELRLQGNLNHYDDPANSYLHRVLERRLGIPVSLAVLWLELAQAVGLSAVGVGFPGHFLVKVHLSRTQVVVLDPLTGASLSQHDLADMLAAWRSDSDSQPPEQVLAWYLQATPPRAILARMLRNLKAVHASGSDWPRLVRVLDRLLLVQPQAWPERRERGLALMAMGRLAEARVDFEAFLALAEPGPERDQVTARLAEIQGRA